MVNVLIVDDSHFVCRTLASLLNSDPDIHVVGTASNGEEALKKVHELDPDVVTLDVEMPKMNGLAALKRIMAEKPCPVIMVSSLTKEGAETTLKALELGALDFVPKLSGSMGVDFSTMGKDLITRVKAVARKKAFMRLVFSRKHLAAENAGASSSAVSASGAAGRADAVSGAATVKYSGTMPVFRLGGGVNYDCVSIGVSTGGPPAVQKVLSALPENFPVPILVAQHMPAAFTGPFAARLNAQSKISVKEAEPVERLRPGTAYVCPGGRHIRLENRKGTLTCAITDEPLDALYRPSANVLMETSGIALGKRALCVMLTGMGSDGLEGTKILKAKGGYAIAQSETTCVIYGMPKAIVDAKLADEIVDIDDMASAIAARVAR